MIPEKLVGKFWLVSAEMGYGHQRAIHPLKILARNGMIINANSSSFATKNEQKLWNRMLNSYEFVSRASQVPFIGRIFTQLLDLVLYIPKTDPIKENKESTIQVRYLKFKIEKGLCKGITEEIKKNPLPIITSFYSSAIAAEMAGYSNIYCIICDNDISRVWASENASNSRIQYFTPGVISAQRLISYGVPKKNIHVTGFPLPLELIGDRDLGVLKTNLIHRLRNLDHDGSFHILFERSISSFLHKKNNLNSFTGYNSKCLTITYALGGAGAQKNTGKKIVMSLADKIRDNKVKLNIVAGTRKGLRDYYEKVKKEILDNHENLNIIWAENNESYFDLFNQCLHTTDLLWTKPSELSFYSALGLPVIMTPAIGPQEKCNQKWLIRTGAGLNQKEPEEADLWLFDWLYSGRLAQAAWNGFMEGRKLGTFNIIDFLNTGTFSSGFNPLNH